MTKKKCYPKYVYQKKFVITSNLLTLIQPMDEETKKNYCFAVSLIIVLSKKNPNYFVEINKKVFHNFIGDDYHEYLNQLEKWGIIEINNNYSNFESNEFCKSFRIIDNSNKVTISFNKKKIKPLLDKSVITDARSEFIFRSLNRIGVLNDLIPTDDLIDEVESEQWSEKIFFGKFDLHYSNKVKRLFHSIILMPSNCRKNLVLKEATAVQLFEYDIKSALPVILLTLTSDENERSKLKLLLDGDIYYTIYNNSGLGYQPRKKIKIQFMEFVFGSIQNYFFDYFKLNYPILSNNIIAIGKEMASYYQSKEASIITINIPDKLLEKSYYNKISNEKNKINSNPSIICVGTSGMSNNETLFIPQHDGWLGLEQDEEEIAKMVKKAFFDLTGYNVIITKKNLKTDQETLLGQKIDCLYYM